MKWTITKMTAMEKDGIVSELRVLPGVKQRVVSTPKGN